MNNLSARVGEAAAPQTAGGSTLASSGMISAMTRSHVPTMLMTTSPREMYEPTEALDSEPEFAMIQPKSTSLGKDSVAALRTRMKAKLHEL